MKRIPLVIMSSVLLVSGFAGADLKPIQPVAPKVLKPGVKLPGLSLKPGASGSSAPAATPGTPAVPRDPSTPAPAPLGDGPLTEAGVVTDPGPQSPFSASADPAGNVYVTNSEADHGLKLRKLSSTGGLLWSVPVVNGSEFGFAIAGNDGALVVSPERVLRFSASGTQQFSTTLGQSAGGGVQAVYDGAGGVFAAFLPYPVTGRVLKRVNRLGAVVFSSAAFPAGPSNIEAGVATDASGNAFLATGGDQITVRKFSAQGALLWTTPVTAQYGEKQNLKVAADAMGGVIVGWSDARRRPNARDVFVQGVTAAGAVRWLANGVEMVRDPGTLGQMSVAPDGTGGAYVAYTSGAGMSEVQRLSPTGAKLWETPGRLGAGNPAQLATDGAGVFAVARKSTNAGPCLSAARLSGTGSQQWADGPKTVGTCVYTIPFFPLVVRAQPFLVYADTRSGYADVYIWR